MIAQVTASQSLIMDYIALTKPRIVVLLLFTALGGMFMASQGAPDLSLMMMVMIGGALASGGAQALNNYLDRDIDEQMSRTRGRVLVVGRIQPGQALLFGVLLNVAAFGLLSAYVNALSAVLTLGATLFYILVYTMGLKRTTPQNIVIGGTAGAIPPMVGWTAVTGQLELPALYLFAIIFFWTPPHFWALALLLKDDYSRARVPMLPVVAGVDETKKAILLYAFLILGLTTMFFATQSVGWIYLAACTPLGIVFVHLAWRLHRQPGIRGAKTLYLYSLLYLALLFVAIMVDSAVTL